METKSIEIKDLIKNFNYNLMSEAILFAGLEPMLQFDEVMSFITEFRMSNSEDVVIFTGYNLEEIEDKVEILSQFNDIILKVGRYRPDLPSKYDEVLKIDLASSNQYAIKL